jgi:hypothetical protein
MRQYKCLQAIEAAHEEFAGSVGYGTEHGCMSYSIWA